MTERTQMSVIAPVIAPVVPADVPVHLLSPIVLAYVGDAVFEVYVRQRLIAGSSRKPHELHRAATKYVSAAAQARLLQRWAPLLTEEEAVELELVVTVGHARLSLRNTRRYYSVTPCPSSRCCSARSSSAACC